MASLGLGMAWTSRDEGWEGAVNNAEKHLDTINEMLEEQGNQATKTGQRVGNLLDVIRNVQLGGISNQLNELTGASNNLTTGFEATFVALGKEAAPFASQLGLQGKEARKLTGEIAGMAYGMKVGASTVGEISVALRTFGKGAKEALDSVGISTKDLVKAQEIGMISGKEYIGTLSDMVNSWDQSAESVGKLANEVVAMGQASGLGNESSKLLTKTINVMDEVFAKTGRTVDELEMAELVRGTQAAAAAFIELGDAPEVASEKAVNLFKMMQDESESQRAMLAGLGGDFGDVFLGLAKESGLGFEKVQDLYDLSPDKFIESLSKVQKTLEKNVVGGGKQAEDQLIRFSQTAAKAGLTFALQAGPKTVEAMDKVRKATENAEGAFKNAAKGFRAGWTLAEGFDAAKDSAIASFRAITRKDVIKDVKRQTKSFREMADELHEAADSGTVWGKAIRSASQFSQIGLRGVMNEFGLITPEMDRYNALMTVAGGTMMDLVSKAQPLMIALTPLTPVIGALGGALFSLPGMIGLGIAAFVLFGDEIVDFVKTHGPAMLDKAIDLMFAGWDMASQFVDEMLVKISKIDFGALAAGFVDGLGNVRSTIVSALTGDLDTSFMDEWRKESTGRNIAGSVEDDIAKALGKVKGKNKKFNEFAGGMAENITAGWAEAIASGDADPTKAFDHVYDKLREAGVSKKAAEAIAMSAHATLSAGLKQAGADETAREEMSDRMADNFSDIPGKIGDFIEGIDLGQVITDALGSATELVKSLKTWLDTIEPGPMIDSMFNTMSVMFKGINWKEIFTVGAELVFTVGSFLVSLFFKGIEFLATSAAAIAALLIETVVDIFAGMGAAIPQIWEESVMPFLKMAWEKVGGFFAGVHGQLTTWVADYMITPIAEKFGEIVDKIVAVLGLGGEEPTSVLGTILGFGPRMLSAGVGWVVQLWEGMKGEFVNLKDNVVGAAQAVLDVWPLSKPKDTASPLQALPKSGMSFLKNIIQGMQEYQPQFVQGIRDITADAAIQGVLAMEEALTLQMSTTFGNIGESIADELKGSASDAVDDFLQFAFNRAQDRIGLVSGAATNALQTAILDLDELASGKKLSNELVLKTSAENTFRKEIRNQTKQLVPHLVAIKTQLKGMGTFGGGRRGTAAPVPVMGTSD